MKVCTDACLFGAWVANKIVSEEIIANNILDIGTGTGLLSLMLAQKINTNITAIEIEEAAYLQAKENINAAFENNIFVAIGDITKKELDKKFDIIICNPPFFENQLKSGDVKRNAAMHATTLSYIGLAKAIQNNITENGKAFLLLPFYAIEYYEKILAIENLFVKHIVQINHSPLHSYFRAILMISKCKSGLIKTAISIKDNYKNYTAEFNVLLKDYYLYL